MLQVDAAFLQTLLRAAESDNQLRVSSVDISLLAGIVNYMSVVRNAVVKGQRGDGTEFTMHLVVKEMPVSEERRAQFRVPQAFEREAMGYDQVLPLLGTSAVAMFPRCLYSQPIVVLEDLRAKGFTMSDRHKGLDLDHCRVAMKGLAYFHAQTMSLMNRCPQAFQKARELLQHEVAFVPEAEETFGVGLENAFTMALQSLEELAITDNAVKTALVPLKPLSGCVFRTVTKLLRPKKDLSTVCHGDCNVTNLMFRYSSDGVPQEVKFLDLQSMRYSSLTTDILYLLFTGAQTCVRRQHWGELVEVYHQELQRESGVEVPLELLKKEMKDHALYGLLCALWLLPVLSTAPQEVPDIQNGENYYEDAKREWTKKLVDTPYATLARDLVLDWNNF